MKEIDFYEEICELIQEVLLDELPEYIDVCYAHNQMHTKMLPAMFSYVLEELQISDSFSDFVPDLAVDALICFSNSQTAKFVFMIVEVKYGGTLGLIDYSQMIGYLHVSGTPKFGLLVNVLEGGSEVVSRELQKTITTGALKLSWEESYQEEKRNFETGIGALQRSGRFDILNSSTAGGFRDFSDLASRIQVALG